MEAEIESFIRYLATERGLSAAYQLSVRQTLDALAAWTKAKAHALADLGTDELSAFLARRKEDGLAASSLRIATVHLKVFFRWLAASGKLPMDPAEPLLSPRPDQTLPETLHASEVKRLLESIDPAKSLGRRDRAMLELFYASGLRLSELGKARLQVMLGHTEYSEREEESLVRTALSWAPAGIVIAGLAHAPGTIKLLRASRVPVVEIWELGATPIDMAVGFSHRQVGAAAADHLRLVDAGPRQGDRAADLAV